MKIYVEDLAVFEDQAARMSLMRMFIRAALGQHSLVVSDSERVLGSSFFQSLALIEQREWPELVQRTLGAHDAENRTEEPGAGPKGIHASIGMARPGRTAACRFPLSASEAGEWAEQALQLLLENDQDWSFIKTAAKACGARAILKAYDNKWLHVNGRGGCPEVLKSLEKRSENDRLFAFVDGDRKHVTGEVSAECSKIVAECGKNPPVPLHVTQKHEIENYVPRAVLAGIVDANKLVAWDALDDAKKDVDDLKVRFGKGDMKKAIQALPNCDAKDLLERAGNNGKEFRDLFAKIEEHL